MIGVLLNCYQAFNVLRDGSMYLPSSLVNHENQWALCLLSAFMLSQLILIFYWIFDKLVPSIPHIVVDGMKTQYNQMVSPSICFSSLLLSSPLLCSPLFSLTPSTPHLSCLPGRDVKECFCLSIS
jgi:hypothetical protein